MGSVEGREVGWCWGCAWFVEAGSGRERKRRVVWWFGGGLEGVGFAGREEGMARGREAGSGVDVLVLVLVDGAGRVRVTSPRFLGSNLEGPTMYGWPPVLVSVFNFLHSLD